MTTANEQRPIPNLESQLMRLLTIDGEKLAYIVLLILAILTRFWDLGVRVMSHDESLHTRYSWNLYSGHGFLHTPLMHGPLLFHMTALSYFLFGDNDFTSRIYTAIVGVIVVMLPYFMRKWLGRTGALAASFLFLISPLILYYSRYIRHDIPAIMAALVMAVAIWRYIEERHFKYLMWLSGAQVVLFASKEVSFIYVAIFGLFLTLYFASRLLDVEWESRIWQLVFTVALLITLGALIVLGIFFIYQGQIPEIISGTETLSPPDPLAETQPFETEWVGPFSTLRLVIASVFSFASFVLVLSVLIGQWRNLRRFPELDVAVVMGTLILPMLSPFLIHWAGFNPMDESIEGIRRSAVFAVPVIIISVLIGVIWGIKPPKPRLVPATMVSSFPQKDLLPEQPDTGDPDPAMIQELDTEDADPAMIEVPPDLMDWLQAFATSRWWAIGSLFWLVFLFFFTTMFTNGNGLGTGIVGSLGYWLEQQEVKRGGQPWYYYILVLLPIYEFLPVILTAAAGAIGLGKVVQSVVDWLIPSEEEPESDEESSEEDTPIPEPERTFLDLDAPISFPVVLFIGFWAVVNLFAYSYAGEKMPWITTHMATPMILLGGWVIGRLLDRIEWRNLLEKNAWVLLLLLPILAVTLLRLLAPACAARPANLLCNTIIPLRYQSAIFVGKSIAELSSTYAWLAALIVLVVVLVAVTYFTWQVRLGQIARLVSLLLVGWLVFLTARAAWLAAFVNYDNASEYLVYAHSSGAVKEVLGQIEEISLKTTDGYGLRVAYDNRVSWPYTWYLRDYYNAVYYADQPSRGLIGEAPVILAGPDNWIKVEPLLGDRYYRFEYIRMWWPMQDYFNLEREDFVNFFTDPALQRGIWEIFYRRDYDAYAQAVAAYRNGMKPSFALSEWPVAERMRFYVRKDIFAQVWDYGVAASEAAEAIDPYAKGVRELYPELIFGSGFLNRPHGIALGPDGLLYVADSFNHRIAVFDKDGNFMRAFGVYGFAPTPGVLNEPWDVAVGPDGMVFIADTWNHRIVKFTPDGEYVTSWGFEGPNLVGEPLAFWGPRAIEVDDQGTIYLADTGNKRIQVFNDKGFSVRQIGSGGVLEGQLDEPVGIALSDDGLLYVADTWNQRIQVFTTDGMFMRSWYVDAWFAETNERPFLDVDAQGNVYVTDPEAFRVIVFDSFGQYLYSFGDYTTLNLAGGILVDDEGYLYITDTAAGTIKRYALNSVNSSAP